MSDSLSAQIDQRILEVVSPLESREVDIISPAYVAESVSNSLDPEHDSPELIAWCATLHLRERCRKLLAKRHDPVKKAESFANGENEDLFGYLLQDYYPSKFRGGGSEPVYIKRDKLTAEEINFNAKRMRRAGESLLQHADALQAYGQDAAKEAL